MVYLTLLLWLPFLFAILRANLWYRRERRKLTPEQREVWNQERDREADIW